MKYAFICALFSVVNNNLEIILIRKFRSSKMNIFSSNSSRVSNVKSLSTIYLLRIATGSIGFRQIKKAPKSMTDKGSL